MEVARLYNSGDTTAASVELGKSAMYYGMALVGTRAMSLCSLYTLLIDKPCGNSEKMSRPLSKKRDLMITRRITKKQR